MEIVKSEERDPDAARLLSMMLQPIKGWIELCNQAGRHTAWWAELFVKDTIETSVTK